MVVGDQRRRASGGETRVPVVRLEHDTKQVKTQHTSKHCVYSIHIHHNTNILLISNAIHTIDTLLALQPSHDSSVAQRCGATWMEICNGKHATLVSSWGHTRLSWLGHLLPVWWHQSHHNDCCRTCFFNLFHTFFFWVGMLKAIHLSWEYSWEYSLHHFHLQMVAGSLFEPWFFSVCNVRLCFRPTPQGLGSVRRDGAYQERMNAMLAWESSLQVRNFLSLVVFYMYRWSQSNLHLCHGWTMPSSTSLNTSGGSFEFGPIWVKLFPDDILLQVKVHSSEFESSCGFQHLAPQFENMSQRDIFPWDLLHHISFIGMEIVIICKNHN